MSENNKSLSLIVSDAMRIEQMLSDSEGEITPEMEAFIAVNTNELALKIDTYNLVLKRLDAAQTLYKEEAAFFAKQSNRCKEMKEKIRDNLEAALLGLRVSELSGEHVTIKLVKTKPSVEITDEKQIPGEYKFKETFEVIQKDRLREDLKIGPVPGAILKEGYSLKVAPKKLQIKGEKSE